MKEDIYENTDPEFQHDGHLIVDKEDYYSLKTFKETFGYNYSEEMENHEKLNDEESQELQQQVNPNDIKKCVSLNSERYSFIYCFLVSDLETYFEKYLTHE